MDDELEDKVLYQTFVSHMKLLSKLAVVNSPPLTYCWKIIRLSLRPEVLFCTVVLVILLLYLRAVDLWSRGVREWLQTTLGRHKKLKLLEVAGDLQSWDAQSTQSSAFAILGRRPKMEDRFIIEENVNNNTGISLFAVFDGHGGEFAADFARDILIKNIFLKIQEIKLVLNQEGLKQQFESSPYMNRKFSQKTCENKENKINNNDVASQRRASFKKSISNADDSTLTKDTPLESDIYTQKINSLIRPLGSNNLFNINNNDLSKQKAPPPKYEAHCYLENGKVNFGKLISDEVLAADYKLVEAAKKTTNIAGTTALIAILDGSKLIVANVGDSRGVMCDSKGNAIPLSFDHKPQQVRERKRINEAGGFIAFRGVWRVAGILATSRAMGDYPLKENNLVIADPDILTFELNDHK
ncbi:PPM1L family protein [Megaselia abdita]